MGYTTRFDGRFNLDKPLTVPQYNELKAFASEDHRSQPGMPGIYCQWIPTEDGMGIEWDGQEKFYDYLNWLGFLIAHFFKPWGITVNGAVLWQGEDITDRGTLLVKDNVVSTEVYTRDAAIPICAECNLSYDIREPHRH